MWIAEYLRCFNATEAARRAGYKHPNVQGSQKKSKFADEISEALEEKAMSAEEAMARLGDIASFDPSPYVRRQGRLISLDVDAMIDDGYGHLIRSVYQTKDGPRVEWADPDWAVGLILQHLTKGASGHGDEPIHVKIVRASEQMDD